MVSKYTLLHICLVLLGLGSSSRARVISLEEAYERALETDQSIAIAHDEAAKARLEPALALTRLTPRLSGDLSSNRTGRFASDTPTTSPINRTSAGAGVSLSQPILDFTVKPAIRAGKINIQSTLLDYQGTVRDTLLAVATAYFDVLTQQKLVAINQESLRLSKEQKDLATARKNVGEVLQTDVLKTEVTVQRAQRTLVESENALKFRRSILANILNLGIEAQFDVAEPPKFPFDNETLTSAVMRAKRQREDLQTSSLAVEKQKAARDEVNARYLPSLSADAGLSRDYSHSSGDGNQENNFQVGISFNIPLFTGGEKSLNLKKSDLEISQASLELQKVEKAVAENVEEAWLQVRTLRQNVEGLKVEVAAAEENYKLLQNQYRAGEVKNLDVVQALTDLNISRTDLTVQTYQLELALRDLARRTSSFEDGRVQRALQRHQSPPKISK